MDNVYFLAWTFSEVFGFESAKFENLEDLKAWAAKYSIKVNAIHEYKNKRLCSVIFEDEVGKSERKKAEDKKRREEIRKKSKRDLYIDFVNGHKFF